MLHIHTGLSICYQQADPSKCRCCPLRVEVMFPEDVFLTSNLGQECYTAFLSVSSLRIWTTMDLNVGLSIGSQMRIHLLLLAPLFEPTQGCHKTVTVA